MKKATGRVLSALFLSLAAGAGAHAADSQTFAIQNIASGKNLRPFEARKADGNAVILYDHHAWKCLTWTFNQVGGEPLPTDQLLHG